MSVCHSFRGDQLVHDIRVSISDFLKSLAEFGTTEDLETSDNSQEVTAHLAVIWNQVSHLVVTSQINLVLILRFIVPLAHALDPDRAISVDNLAQDRFTILSTSKQIEQRLNDFCLHQAERAVVLEEFYNVLDVESLLPSVVNC